MAKLGLGNRLSLESCPTSLIEMLRWQAAQHHDSEGTKAALLEVARACPNITNLYSVGQSVEGRELLVLEFTTNPGRLGVPSDHEPR